MIIAKKDAFTERFVRDVKIWIHLRRDIYMENHGLFRIRESFRVVVYVPIPSANVLRWRREHLQVAERSCVFETADIFVANLRDFSLGPMMQLLVQRPLSHRFDDSSKNFGIVLLVRGFVERRRPLLRNRRVSCRNDEINTTETPCAPFTVPVPILSFPSIEQPPVKNRRVFYEQNCS